MVKKNSESKNKKVKALPAKKVNAGKPSKKTVKKAASRPVRKKAKTPALKKIHKKTLLPGVPAEIPVLERKEEKKPLHPSHIYDKYDTMFQDSYGETGIVLLPRDPYWLFAYWEVTPASIEQAKKVLGNDFNSSKTILRVYEVTNIIFNGRNAHSSFDIILENLLRSWYINVPLSEKNWIVDIGILAPSGKYFLLSRSNAVATPADSISNTDYEEWMDSAESWKMYTTRAGANSKNRAGTCGIYGAEDRAFEASSAGVSSLAGPVRFENKASAFWLKAGTEIIVYGATEPDARVTINGNPVRLNADGSFSTRFALTDGLHLLDISGRSASGNYKKTFKLRVTQETYKEE